MDIDRLNTYYTFLREMTHRPTPLNYGDIQNTRNFILSLATEIEEDQPLLSDHLKKWNEQLFIKTVPYIRINPFMMGRILEILGILLEQHQRKNKPIWGHIHPRIISVSKKLYLDGHYANAAEDAFIEVNAHVKKLYSAFNPNEPKIPDGVTLMNKLFSEDNPLVSIHDRSTQTGRDIHNGYRFMLAGAMSALRNPKAHSNDEKLSPEEAMRRLMFASMLMYKIDEAVKKSEIEG